MKHSNPSISKGLFPALTCKSFLEPVQNKSTASTHWAALWPRASSQPLRTRVSGTQHCIYPAHPECFKLLNTSHSPMFVSSPVFSHCIQLNLTGGHCGEPISHVRYHSHLLMIDLSLKTGSGTVLKILYLLGTCHTSHDLRKLMTEWVYKYFILPDPDFTFLNFIVISIYTVTKKKNHRGS